MLTVKYYIKGIHALGGLIDDIDLKHPDCAKEYWEEKEE